MKAKDRRALFERVQEIANFEPVEMSTCMALVVREVDRAVHKARREMLAKVESPRICGTLKGRRAPKAGRRGAR